jgi:hypothetical protein
MLPDNKRVVPETELCQTLQVNECMRKSGDSVVVQLEALKPPEAADTLGKGLQLVITQDQCTEVGHVAYLLRKSGHIENLDLF